MSIVLIVAIILGMLAALICVAIGFWRFGYESAVQDVAINALLNNPEK